MKYYTLSLIFVFSLSPLILAQDIMENFTVQRMDGEKLKWDLQAKIAKFKGKQTELEGVRLKFYPEDKAPFTVEAEKGCVGKNREEIYLEKNVLIKGYSGTDLRTEDLSWDSTSEVFLTSKNVTVKGKKWIINGEGMRFDPEQDLLIINNGVEMKIQMNSPDTEVM